MILSASRMVLSQFLRLAIERSGGLVEKQDGAVAYHYARDSKPLALAPGQRRTALAHHGVIALAIRAMNSSASASLAAWTISSRGASGRPKAMFSWPSEILAHKAKPPASEANSALPGIRNWIPVTYRALRQCRKR
jgi:hypothetical protein